MKLNEQALRYINDLPEFLDEFQEGLSEETQNCWAWAGFTALLLRLAGYRPRLVVGQANMLPHGSDIGISYGHETHAPDDGHIWVEIGKDTIVDPSIYNLPQSIAEKGGSLEGFFPDYLVIKGNKCPKEFAVLEYGKFPQNIAAKNLVESQKLAIKLACYGYVKMSKYFPEFTGRSEKEIALAGQMNALYFVSLANRAPMDALTTMVEVLDPQMAAPILAGLTKEGRFSETYDLGGKHVSVDVKLTGKARTFFEEVSLYLPYRH